MSRGRLFKPFSCPEGNAVVLLLRYCWEFVVGAQNSLERREPEDELAGFCQEYRRTCDQPATETADRDSRSEGVVLIVILMRYITKYSYSFHKTEATGPYNCWEIKMLPLETDAP